MNSLLRHRWFWIVAAGVALGATLLAARLWLGGYVVRSVLRMAGATEIRHGEVRGTPWRLEVADLACTFRSQPVSARRVILVREKWWQASLGDVQVEGARVPVALDNSDVQAVVWDTYEDGGLGDEPVPPPFRSLALEGELVVRMALTPDRPVAVKLESQPRSGTSWIGSLVAEAEGFRLAGSGTLLRAGQELDFQVHSAELDLASWSPQIQRLVLLPGGPWTLAGRLTGVAEGKVTAKRFAATARVSLREADFKAGTRDITLTGAEADLEFSDLWKLRTSAGRLQVRQLRAGRLPFDDLDLDFGLWNGKQINVSRAVASALGGRVETQPFGYQLGETALTLELKVADLRVAKLFELAPRVAPRLGGRALGRLVLRMDESGVLISTGELATLPGVPADLQFNAAALVRSGATMDAATERLFKAAGNQSVLVRVEECRFEIRPPGLPLGTTARCVVRGWVDAQPVAFTYPVNGAVERFLAIMP
ncbi:hypothetical protein ESB00_12295 [Oleiharenicola lentus]|uniref:Uncharacterized protein n=1 Tax=Oleiharenicola lentus TaxID=2508720 RepID=A0A4V1M6U4_9BACT|nr:YdbH domain-containing protein [Oleiharenicola lentus]RXK56609.1 hypothetical protein ESB00_12295 [Oleiharenicola lentus]